MVLLSESRGKISAVAKGIRRTKSKFGARLEPFNLVDLLLYKGKTLDTITAVEIMDSFSGLRKDFEKTNLALAMLDLVDKLTIEEADKRVFDLLQSGLSTLSELKSNLDLFLIAFDLKLISLSGFMPTLSRCLICEVPLSQIEAVFLSPERGGVICQDCSLQEVAAGEVGGELAANRQSVELLFRLIKASRSDFGAVETSQEVKDEARVLTSAYIDRHIAFRLKSRDCINRMNDSIKRCDAGDDLVL